MIKHINPYKPKVFLDLIHFLEKSEKVDRDFWANYPKKNILEKWYLATPSGHLFVTSRRM